MKILKLIPVLFFSFGFSQTISKVNDCLLINDSIKLCKNSSFFINNPSQFNFISITPVEKKKFNLKKLVNVAEIAGMGGSALGSITNDANTILTSAKVLNTTNQVQNVIWTADKIKELNVSDNSKKIIGKSFVILKWEETELDSKVFSLLGKIDNKEYKINLNSALTLHEIFF